MSSPCGVSYVELRSGILLIGEPYRLDQVLQGQSTLREVPEGNWDPEQRGGCEFARSVAAAGLPVAFRACAAVQVSPLSLVNHLLGSHLPPSLSDLLFPCVRRLSLCC